MKRILPAFLLLCCFTCLGQRVAKNKFKLGVKAGFAFTEATCIRINGFEKKGFVGGFLFQLKLNKSWTGELDLLFVEKGSRNTGDPKNNYYGQYYLRLNYIEWPVLFQYHRKRMTYEFGPGFGYLVFAREFSYDGTSGQGNLSNDDPFSQREMSFNIGLSFALNQDWAISCRYTNSILKIRESTGSPRKYDKLNTLNCVLAFTLVRTFDLKKKQPEKKE